MSFEVPTGVVADHDSRRLSIIIGVVLIGCALLIQGILPTLGAVLTAQVVWGIGYTFTSGADEAWITDEIGEDRVGPVFTREQQQEPWPLRFVPPGSTAAWTHATRPCGLRRCRRSRATVISMNGQLDAIGQVVGGPPLGALANRTSTWTSLLVSALILSPAIALHGRLRAAPEATAPKAPGAERPQPSQEAP